MPGFLGGLAGGLAKKLEKAGDDYTKTQADMAKEQRQAERVESVRQAVRSEDFFSQNFEEGKPVLLVLPDANGNPISKLEGARYEEAVAHNEMVKRGLLSTNAENEKKLAIAEDYTTKSKEWRAANPKDPRTYDQYVKDTDSARDFGEAIGLQDHSGMVARQNAAFSNSLPSKDGGGGKDKWTSKPLIKGIYNNASGGKYLDQNVKAAAAAIGLKDYNVTKLMRMLEIADDGDPNARNVIERMAPHLRAIDNVAGAVPVGQEGRAGVLQRAINTSGVIDNTPKK